MSRASFLLLFAALLAGCLEPGPPPEGRLLFAGRNIESPSFLELAEETWVEFEVRKQPASPRRGGVSDLHLVSWDGTRQRTVVENVSDRWATRWAGDARFFMTDERPVENASELRYGSQTMATLVRIGPGREVVLRIPGVSSFTVHHSRADRVLYRKPASADGSAGLYLWDGTLSRRLGDSPASSLLSMEVRETGAVYFVSGDDRALYRLVEPDGPVERIRDQVSRFLLRGDDRWMTVALIEEGRIRTVVQDLETGIELELARPNPCCWMGFSGETFVYSHSASGEDPAELHTLELTTGEDRVLLLPRKLSDLAGVMGRPGSDEVLLLDSRGNGVFCATADMQPRRELAQRVISVSFTADGRDLIYIDQAPLTVLDPTPGGALMLQDAELTAPPRRLSPPGLQAGEDGYFFIHDQGKPVLVFWAQFGRNTSDLYFADVDSGEVRLVSQSIRDVSVTPDRVFGIVNISQQDLVGDLVLQDLRQQHTRVLAHAVARAALRDDADPRQAKVAFVVRGRVPMDHDGLWATTLEPAAADGGVP